MAGFDPCIHRSVSILIEVNMASIFSVPIVGWLLSTPDTVQGRP